MLSKLSIIPVFKNGCTSLGVSFICQYGNRLSTDICAICFLNVRRPVPLYNNIQAVETRWVSWALNCGCEWARTKASLWKGMRSSRHCSLASRLLCILQNLTDVMSHVRSTQFICHDVTLTRPEKTVWGPECDAVINCLSESVFETHHNQSYCSGLDPRVTNWIH